MHGESSRTITQSVKWTCDVAPDLATTGKEQAKKQAKQMVKLSPPPHGRLRINVDASYSVSLHHGGTGVGLRDHTGKLLRAQALWYESAASALVMEAYAVRDRWCADGS